MYTTDSISVRFTSFGVFENWELNRFVITRLN